MKKVWKFIHITYEVGGSRRPTSRKEKKYLHAIQAGGVHRKTVAGELLDNSISPSWRWSPSPSPSQALPTCPPTNQPPSTYRVPLLDPKHSKALPSAATTAAAPLANRATAAPGPASTPGDRGVSNASASGKDHL